MNITNCEVNLGNTGEGGINLSWTGISSGGSSNALVFFFLHSLQCNILAIDHTIILWFI